MDPALPPILHNAGIIISAGRIAAIGDLADLRRQHGHLPLATGSQHKGLLLPGLINAHTHLELSYQSAAALDPTHFTRWVSSLIASYPPPDQLESVIRTAFRTGLQKSLSAGITTLGDITRNVEITRTEYARLQLDHPAPVVPRLISFGEVVALGKMRDKLPERLATALTPPLQKLQDSPPAAQPPYLSPGNPVIAVSPHAPYTVEGPALRAIVRAAIIKRTPLCMHLAELAEETDFLRDLSGPLGRDWDLMQKMDVLDHAIPPFDGGPIRWAQRWGLLVRDSRDFPTLFAHVNYCDNAELNALATHACSVVYCPRTHAYFRHLPHRYRDMLDAQINVCLGTDSLASNPDLNVLHEAALLHTRDTLLAYLALDMVTRRAAQALGLIDHVGTLAPNKCADLVLFPLHVPANATADDLAAALLQSPPAPTAVYLAGQPVSTPR